MTSEKTRVMLVDDHETVREGLRALLRHLDDVEVVSAWADGNDALKAAASDPPDLLVLDLSMPTHGLVILRSLATNVASPAVIVLTRHREAAYLREAMAAGAMGYVLKQSPFTELRAAIAAVKRGERYVDSDLAPTSEGRAESAGGKLTSREEDVLRRAAQGLSNKEIASACNIAVKTVEVHKANAMRKLGLKDRTDLTRHAMGHRWLTDL